MSALDPTAATEAFLAVLDSISGGDDLAYDIRESNDDLNWIGEDFIRRYKEATGA